MTRILYGCCYTADLQIKDVEYIDILPDLKKSNNCLYIQKDIREVDFNNYDVIICSPPCNYYSRANYRRDSSHYALSTRDLLPLCINKANRTNKPFIIENVRNSRAFSKLQIPQDIYIYEYGRHTYFTNIMLDLSGLPQKEARDVSNIQWIPQKHRQGGYSVNVVFLWFLSVVLNKDFLSEVNL